MSQPDLVQQKCHGRGDNCHEPVIYHGPDPYREEILGDDTRYFLCEDHYEQSRDEV